jgi:hypothetical protein
MNLKQQPPRKGRIAFAVVLCSLTCVPGIWAFFLAKHYLPQWFLHTTGLFWFDFALVLLAQIAVTAICMLPLLWVVAKVCRRLLTQAEMAYLTELFQD